MIIKIKNKNLRDVVLISVAKLFTKSLNIEKIGIQCDQKEESK